MKLSEQLKQDSDSGDFGHALDGYSERAAKLEYELEMAKLWMQKFCDHCPFRIQDDTANIETTQSDKYTMTDVNYIPPYLRENFKKLRDSDLSMSAGSEFREELWQDALNLAKECKAGRWVVPYLQRKLRIGYNRAARIGERMDELGITVEQRIPQND